MSPKARVEVGSLVSRRKRGTFLGLRVAGRWVSLKGVHAGQGLPPELRPRALHPERERNSGDRAQRVRNTRETRLLAQLCPQRAEGIWGQEAGCQGVQVVGVGRSWPAHAGSKWLIVGTRAGLLSRGGGGSLPCAPGAVRCAGPQGGRLPVAGLFSPAPRRWPPVIALQWED